MVADLIVLMTVLLGAGAVVLAALEAVVFFTTVALLASLDSLVALIFRLPRVAAADGGGAAAFRDRVVVARVGAGFVLAVDEVVVFLVTAAGRVAFAFSTMLDRMLDEDFVFRPLTGEAGRPITDLAGDAGRSAGRSLVFDEAGDRT